MVRYNLFIRGQVIGMMKCNKTPSWISEQLEIPSRTICRWIRRFRETGSVEDKAKSGRPRLTSLRAVRQLVRWAKSVQFKRYSANMLLRIWGVPVSKYT